jgi:hypothetical protein
MPLGTGGDLFTLLFRYWLVALFPFFESNHATYPGRRCNPPAGYAAEDAHGTVAEQDGCSGPSGENADVATSVSNDFGRQILNCPMILSDGGMEGVDPRTVRTGNE